MLNLPNYYFCRTINGMVSTVQNCPTCKIYTKIGLFFAILEPRIKWTFSNLTTKKEGEKPDFSWLFALFKVYYNPTEYTIVQTTENTRNQVYLHGTVGSNPTASGCMGEQYQMWTEFAFGTTSPGFISQIRTQTLTDYLGGQRVRIFHLHRATILFLIKNF